MTCFKYKSCKVKSTLKKCNFMGMSLKKIN